MTTYVVLALQSFSFRLMLHTIPSYFFPPVQPRVVLELLLLYRQSRSNPPAVPQQWPARPSLPPLSIESP